MITKLVITSANISQYHLIDRVSGRTCESCLVLSGLSIEPSALGVFFNVTHKNKSFIRENVAFRRVSFFPQSIVVDIRKGVSVSATDEPLINRLKLLGPPEYCGAPFVNNAAIIKNLSPTESFRVYSGEHKTKGMILHAKIMKFSNSIALGSVNWTAQGMGIGGSAINHETLLLVSTKQGCNLLLSEFPSRVLEEAGQEYPGDEDPDEGIGANWLEERKLRINAPEQALLKIHDNVASIVLQGTYCPISNCRIKSLDSDEDIVVKVANNILQQPKSLLDRRLFASILASGGAVIYGLAPTRGIEIWKIELNYQDFWPILIEDGRKRFPMGSGGGSRESSDGKEVNFSDVRTIRNRVIAQGDLSKRVSEFSRWLSANGINAEQIPDWCLDLANKIPKGFHK